MVSSQYAMLGRFYQVLFGMQTSPKPRPEGAVTVGDGYVGLNLNPRKPGRAAGLDHFGVQVDDVDTVFERITKHYSKLNWLKRPDTRPFAGITAHDPDGNIFDLSQDDMENRKDIYTDGNWEQERQISHYAIRTINPEACAEFYSQVLDLQVGKGEDGDGNFYITDGRMTVVLMPWDIRLYAGMGISRPGPDHFAFRVESIEALKRDFQAMIDRNQTLTPPAVGVGPEGTARLELLQRSTPYARFHICDLDNVMIAIGEE
jgi:catechol 2,3-dioxygenase-like lactoylglutathione lyase family enzyme